MKIENDIVSFDAQDTDSFSSPLKAAFSSSVKTTLEQYLSDVLNAAIAKLVSSIAQQKLNSVAVSIPDKTISEQLAVLQGLDSVVSVSAIPLDIKP